VENLCEKSLLLIIIKDAREIKKNVCEKKRLHQHQQQQVTSNKVQVNKQNPRIITQTHSFLHHHQTKASDTTKMHIEVQVALNFVISYLYNKLPRRRVNIFGEELEKALKHKFQGHWYPDKPFKVSIDFFLSCCS